MASIERYEQEYKMLSDSLTKKIQGQLPALAGEPKKSVIRIIERELEEADEILHNMELELNSLPPATKNRWQPRLRTYRTDYEKLKSNLRSEATKQNDRDALFSGMGDASLDADVAGMDQRQKLLAGTNRLRDGTDRLERAHAVALETEQVGTDTLMNLRNQREQLQSTGQRIDEANTFMDRNMRILKSMSKRMATNRLMSLGIILALIAVIILILYIKFA